MSLLEDLEELKAKAQQSLGEVRSSEALEEWRIRYLGTKGAVKEAVRRRREVPRESAPRRVD